MECHCKLKIGTVWRYLRQTLARMLITTNESYPCGHRCHWLPQDSDCTFSCTGLFAAESPKFGKSFSLIFEMANIG